jgi:LacI family transcriptional regulator
MVTRDDVANRAGISPAVVSYVVNGGPRRVAPGTRSKVLRAIEDLGYRPNGLARALRVQKTFTIGLIVPDNTNPFFAQLARAVEETAFARGYVLLLGNSGQDDKRQAAYVRTFLERKVDGLVLIADSDTGRSPLPEVTASELKGAGVPLVLLDRSPSDLWAPSVTVDNEGGAYIATRHLIEHGHREVACLAGPDDLHTARRRTRGWRRALREAGITPRPDLVARSRFRRDEGYRAVGRLLSGRPRPTALFAESDAQAIGVLRWAQENGVRVPEDLALVSFDGIEEAAYTTPPLTTVAQPIEELGRRSVELLVGPGAAGTPAPGYRPEALAVELVRRRTCGCNGGDDKGPMAAGLPGAEPARRGRRPRLDRPSGGCDAGTSPARASDVPPEAGRPRSARDNEPAAGERPPAGRPAGRPRRPNGN